MVLINTRQIVCSRGNPDLKNVAITFDDGPSDPYTDQVLDILRQYGIKATFFMVGRNVDRFPKIARRVASAGHEIGNHTYNHSSLFLDAPRRIALELAMGEESILRTTGVSPRLFRPPYGANPRWVMTQALRRGYIITKWSVNAGDWRKASAVRIVKKTLARIGNGAIILMHDGACIPGNNHRYGTVSALPQILDALKSSGYKVVSVSELLGLTDFFAGSKNQQVINN